jgi:hypothetical protein
MQLRGVLLVTDRRPSRCPTFTKLGDAIVPGTLLDRFYEESSATAVGQAIAETAAQRIVQWLERQASRVQGNAGRGDEPVGAARCGMNAKAADDAAATPAASVVAHA